MDYQFYQILFLFAIYSILGWIVEEGLYGIKGQPVNRGFLKGPAGLMYGAGALLVVFILSPFQENLVYAMCGAILICVFLELIVLVFIKMLSGVILWKYYFFFPLIGGLMSVAVIKHVQPLMDGLLNILPMWLIFIFLLIFYAAAISDFVDSVDLLLKFRKGMKKLLEAEVDNLEYAEMICNFLEPYGRWLRAYPNFRKAAMKKMFRDKSLEEIIVIKNAIKNHLQ